MASRGRQKSNLPDFERTECVDDDDFGDADLTIKYTCKRKGCERSFVVVEAEDLERETAPCPHCFRVSIVPSS